jgi:hypothetical protein
LRHVTATADAFHSMVLVDLLMILRRLRASSILAETGYHGPAFSLLRDVRDSAIVLSAVFQGKAKYGDLAGVNPDIPSKPTRTEARIHSRSMRKKTEKRIFNHFFDFNDFSQQDRKHLEIWQDLFDRENHRSGMSTALAAESYLTRETSLSLINSDDQMLMAAYLTRFYDVAWMYHRLLPNLQSSTKCFDARWKEKWTMLDQSFWQMLHGKVTVGKSIGPTISIFVDRRFPFNSESRWNSPGL